jgi:hypothetical protein
MAMAMLLHTINQAALVISTDNSGNSCNKTAFTIYIMPGFSGYADLMEQLGTHKTGKSCLYLKNLDVVDRDVLEQLIRQSVEEMHEKYECS